MSSVTPEHLVVQEISSVVDRTDTAHINALVHAILDAERVFVGGAGRSLMAMQMFAMRLMHIGITSHVVGETTTPAIEEGDLLIVASGSGQTRISLALVEAANERRAQTAVITAHPEQIVPSNADLVLHIHSPIIDEAARMASEQPPGSLFEQCVIIHGEAIILRLIEHLGTTIAEMRQRHTKLE